jgi:hypothetical protein
MELKLIELVVGALIFILFSAISVILEAIANDQSFQTLS